MTILETEESNTMDTEINWHLKKGERACRKTFLVLHKFNIPTDNDQTLNEILCEVLKLKSKKSSGLIHFNLKERNGNNAQYIRIPSRERKHCVTAIGTTITST